MKSKFKNSLLAVFVIIATAGIFLLLNKDIFDTVMCWFAFALIMVSELFLATAWVNFNAMPQRFAVVTVSAFQTAITLLLAALFINLFPKSYVGYAILNIITFTVLIVLTYFFYRASNAIEKTASAKDFFQKCRLAVNAAANTPNGDAHRVALEKLEENLRFCNDGILLDADDAIYDAICDLQSIIASDNGNVAEQINAINAMIQQHDFAVKTAKR